MRRAVRRKEIRPVTALAALTVFAACGDRAETGEAAGEAFVADTIEISMITDDNGNYFEPSDVTARPGDVIRLELVSGVHNFHIPPATNPDAEDLPEPSPMLQLPGQTWDWTVDLAPGAYAFQCDPHAALGMVGNLTVTN